jgi:hypothetical protein
MKKRLFKGLTASVIAVMLAAVMALIPVSATFTYRGVTYPGMNPEPSESYKYATESVYSDGKTWYPNYDAYYEKNDYAPLGIKEPIHHYSNSRQYFNADTGDYLTEDRPNTPYVYYVSRKVSNTDGDGVSYKAADGNFYPTTALAQEAGSTLIQMREYKHRGSGDYFNIKTGRYYATLSDALNATGSAYDILLYLDTVWYDRNYTETYFNFNTQVFYLSEAEAYEASPTVHITRQVTPSQGYYFNRATGDFYVTLYEAVGHSRESDVIRATSFSFTNGIMNSFGYDEGYYGMPTYTPTFTDDAGYNTVTPTDEATSSSPYDAESTATLRTNASQKGWAALAKLVNNTSAGANIMINLNQDKYVSSTFMKAVAGRDINVTIVTSGATIRFNGFDIYNPKDMPIAVVFSANIPNDVAFKTRSAASADSTSVFTIGADVDLGAVVSLTVRFNASREEDNAALYHYHTGATETKLVDSKEIGENGSTTFEIREGGQFMVCIKETDK